MTFLMINACDGKADSRSRAAVARHCEFSEFMHEATTSLAPVKARVHQGIYWDAEFTYKTELTSIFRCTAARRWPTIGTTHL